MTHEKVMIGMSAEYEEKTALQPIEKIVESYMETAKSELNNYLKDSKKCMFNIEPPCDKEATHYPKIAGFTTPLCEEHFQQYDKKVNKLISRLKWINNEDDNEHERM